MVDGGSFKGSSSETDLKNISLMKNFILFLFSLISFNIFSQYCNTATTNVAITPTTTAQLTASYNSGRRAFNFTATAGCTYQFETCGYSTADTYLRLYSTGTGGTVLAFSDDACGSQSRIVWTCTTTGTYSILLTNWSCANLNSATRVRYVVNSCVTPYDPCSSITTISGCGTSVSTTMSGTGAGWNVNSCGFSTPGQERIFQFTATATGTYTLNVSSITGGYVDFFWKPASGGCVSTGWNCIDDITSTGVYNGGVAMSFTAGTTYYILLDPEGTGSYNVTFNLVCPPTPPANDLVCNAITMSCGQSVAGTTIGSNLTGTGEGGSCGVTQTTGGVWYRIVGTGDIMTASLCATSWDSKISVFEGTCTSLTCVGGIDDNGPSCSGTSASYSWTSVNGVNYYILVHGYSTTSMFAMSINCTPPPPPGPCLNVNSYTIETLPTSNSVTTSCLSGFGQFTDEYSQWNSGVAGETYTVWSSYNTDWITVTVNTPNGTVVQYGQVPLSFTAPTNSTYYIHVNVDGYCLEDANCRDITVTKTMPLPVELIDFSGFCKDRKNYINWTTASEHNSDYFKVEKSTNGKDWTLLDEVQAAGNSTTIIDYQVVDEQPGFENNYYRLTQYDFDGQFETFNIISVNCENSSILLNVYPNPSNGQFVINYNPSMKTESSYIEITDSFGKSIERISNLNSNNVFIDSNFSPGVYYVIYKNTLSVDEIKQIIIK